MEITNNPLVSIVIPVYNTQKELFTKCMDSILKQTYTNCEYIVVDDGSKKEIADFLDDFAKSDSRIKVFHQENAGASEARNTGLKYIAGKYFCFFDADDYCSIDFVEVMVNAAEKNGSDLVIANFALISDVTNKELAKASNKYECSVNVNDSIRLALMEQTFHYVPHDISLVNEPYECSTKELWLQGKVWGKLYQTDLYKDERFVKGIPVSQDAVYTIDVLKKCRNVSFCKDIYYYYYVNDGSLVRRKHAEKGLEIQFVSMKQKLELYPSVFEGMYSLLMFGSVRSIVGECGVWGGYRKIRNLCLLPSMMEINKNLSLNGVAHSQEERTRKCLRGNRFLLLAIIAKLSMVKEKMKRK